MKSISVVIATAVFVSVIGLACSSQDTDTTASTIPPKFLGVWIYKQEAKVIGQMTLAAKSIEWKHVVLDQEDKMVTETFSVTPDREKVTFDAKVTYSRDVFFGGAHKGDAQVTLQVKDGTMSVEIGGTKTEEAGGVVITTPPKVYEYVKATETTSSANKATRGDVPVAQTTALDTKPSRVSDRHCTAICLRLAQVGISNGEIKGKMTPISPDVNAYEMTYPANFQGTVTDAARAATIGLKSVNQGDKVEIQILSATEFSVKITNPKTGVSIIAELGAK